MGNLFLNSQLHFVDLDFYFLHCAISSQVFPQAFHSMTRVWMRRKKVLFLKEEVCSKILIYAMRLIQFSCSRYLWWLENVLFVSGRLTYCWRSGGSIPHARGRRITIFGSNESHELQSQQLFGRERAREGGDGIGFYFLLFSLHFHFSSEWRTIVYLACKSILKGFFLWRTHYMCCNGRAIDDSLIVEFIRE